MKQPNKHDFPTFRKARDALFYKFGTVNKSRLVSQSIPYVIMFYLVDKEAWLYRNCIGGSAFDRLIAVLMNFGLPFQNPMPSLHYYDLLAGLAGALILWAVVTYRKKNAKKFRQGEEYGSARWGNEKDIQPFIDPVFENNILLTQTERLTMNSRPSKPQYARNKNVIVIGGSGSGKTRFYVKPNLMQMPEKASYVVTDPKGTIVVECGKMLEKAGYEIKVLNTINFRKSMHYNPFMYIRSEKDILKLANTIIANTKGEGEKSSEDFWVKAERLLYCALIGYIYYEAPEEEQNFATLLEFLNASEAREDDEEFKNAVDLLFEELEAERIEADILNNFKVLGVSAFPLNGVERLQIMYETFNPDQSNPFTFDYNQLISNGLSTKDFIAPTSFTFRNGKYFMMGSTFGAASYLQILAPELTDKMLAEFLDMDKNLIVNLHVQSIEQMKAVKLVKSKVTDINRMKIEEQKKAVRSGYDMDIIPSDLMTYGNEAKRLLEDLQSRNERMFLVTVIFLNTAKTKQELDNVVFQTAGIAQKYNCALRRLDYMQEQGLMSSLPLGLNQIPIKRALTTTSTAIFVPFTTQELFMEGESLYYGLNALSNNMIMVDRKKLKNPNGLILGTPGSGKSFSAKREITNAFFVTKDDIIICDPEGEYYPLVHALGGQVVHISPTSHDYINPMDINLDYSDDDNPLGFKSDFVLSLCELIMGSRDGIEAEEKSVIDRCLPLVYQKYFADPVPENMPVLGDLYDTLRAQKEEQAQRIATALEIYVNGSLKVFNHQTNVELGNRIICFDIKDLGKQLKKLGMLIVQDQVWNRVTLNRYEHKSTRYYVDEFHLLLKEEQTAAYSVEIWKRFRKWGGIPTGITQNIKDLLASREIENIFENSDFIYMLNQASGDRQILAKQLNISPYQLSYVTNSGEGEGLLFYGNIIIPFKDRFDKSLKLYSLMTTKPEEVEKRVESEEAEDEDDSKNWHTSEALSQKEAGA